MQAEQAQQAVAQRVGQRAQGAYVGDERLRFEVLMHSGDRTVAKKPLRSVVLDGAT